MSSSSSFSVRAVLTRVRGVNGLVKFADIHLLSLFELVIEAHQDAGLLSEARECSETSER